MTDLQIVRPSNTQLFMTDGIFKDLFLNIPQHKAWILANLDFVHRARLKISQGVGS
jgi:hypothetical protein